MEAHAHRAPAPEPDLYAIPRHRLWIARKRAADRAQVAILAGHVHAARIWCRIVTDCDAELNRTHQRAG